jgi:GNAT superfamily N-acetyltransferase
MKTKIENFEIRFATEADVPLILEFILALAEYERLATEVTANEELIHDSLFGEKRNVEAIFGEFEGKPVAFAVFFHNFSTFVGKRGLYLEDLFVKPEWRGNGIGKLMLSFLANLAVERNCGRFEWWVLNWNEPAIEFYKSLGAMPMDEWTVFRLVGESLTELAEEF